MEDKVKETTGKPVAKRRKAPEPKETTVEVKKEKKEDPKGKVSTIQVNTDGSEAQRVVGWDEVIADFWTHRPTIKKQNNAPELHLVNYNGHLRWFSFRQVEITMRRVKEIIVDNTNPRTDNYLSFPKFTSIIVEGGSKCKGCQ